LHHNHELIFVNHRARHKWCGDEQPLTLLNDD